MENTTAAQSSQVKSDNRTVNNSNVENNSEKIRNAPKSLLGDAKKPKFKPGDSLWDYVEARNWSDCPACLKTFVNQELFQQHLLCCIPLKKYLGKINTLIFIANC